MSANAKVALLVPIEPNPGKEPEVEQFIHGGFSLVQAEPLTLQWYAVRTGAAPHTYAIFDTFATEEGRNAHLSGKVAEALTTQAPTLLSEPLDVGKADILAAKVKTSPGAKNGGVGVGLRVHLDAKPEKVETVKQFLTSALDIVNEEEETRQWYAIHVTGTTSFAIIDFFVDSTGREAHLNGKVAKALFAAADDLFASRPDVTKVDVLAAIVRS